MSGVLGKARVFFGFGGEELETTVRQEPVRQQVSSKVTVLRTRRNAVEGNDIFTVEPTSYQEARQVADHFSSGVSVIVNMAQMSEADCRRMLDYMLGLQHALDGHLKRVTSKVFVLTPASVNINDEEDEMLSEEDLLIQP